MDVLPGEGIHVAVVEVVGRIQVLEGAHLAVGSVAVACAHEV